LGVVVGVVIVAAAVVLPLYFLVIKKHHDDSAAASGGGGNASGGKGGNNVVGAVTGGDGSTVVTSTGQSFVYKNSFGGYCAFSSLSILFTYLFLPGMSDPANPFLNGAKPNSWTPALNESWNWGTDKIYGVNLGGWFVLEPCACSLYSILFCLPHPSPSSHPFLTSSHEHTYPDPDAEPHPHLP
jgi:hypothetical protein